MRKNEKMGGRKKTGGQTDWKKPIYTDRWNKSFIER
jgi:hypothetical protein